MSSSSISKSSSTGSVKVNLLLQVTKAGWEMSTASDKIVFSFSHSHTMDALQSSASMSKRSSVKANVSSCYIKNIYICVAAIPMHGTLSQLYTVDWFICFPEGCCGDETVISCCEKEFLYWICEGKGEVCYSTMLVKLYPGIGQLLGPRQCT